MKTRLGVNTGFAVNRYTEHEEWARLIGETLGSRYVQLTADLLSPYLPDEAVRPQVKHINELASSYSIKIESTYTGAFTRLNHLAHPHVSVRKYWLDWFKRFADISAQIGAKGMGSHFGILTVKQASDPRLREKTMRENIAGWHEIAKHAQRAGIEYLMWEPMSVKREYGETIAETEKLHELVNDGIAIPMKLCLDVDHGDVSSKDPKDTDPYAWLEKFGAQAGCVHIKQSSANKGGHWPFTAERNKDGRVKPEKVLSSLEKGGCDEITLFLELSFREREPAESNVVPDLKESVAYWRNYVSD